MEKIKKLLLSGNNDDFLIGIALLSKHTSKQIIEFMKSLGAKHFEFFYDTFAVNLDRGRFGGEGYIICGRKYYFRSSTQFQFSKNKKFITNTYPSWTITNLNP